MCLATQNKCFLHLNPAQAGTSNGWVEFDNRIKLEFHGAAVTSDAGLVAYRELDEAMELTQMGKVFRDSRRGKNTQYELIGLLRQSVYSRLAGYEDTNDAERLAVDSVMRQVIGGRARDHQAGIGQSDGPLRDEDSDDP